VVIGTTGHTAEEKQAIQAAAAHIPVFFSGNMSLGIAVLCRLAKQAATMFPEADIEIVEVHHTRKVDAPSGTAKMLFEAVKEVRPQAWANCGRSGEGKREKDEIGISALRMGNVVGIHEVHICTPSQTLTLRHEAGNRAMFADGAVAAAEFLQGKAAGLYNMEHFLGEK
jgi:4-hydroxy-tetrahydrodipicolinate reductase